jgi:hypothetical protein
MRVAIAFLAFCTSAPAWAQREQPPAAQREAAAFTVPCTGPAGAERNHCEQLRSEFVREYVRARAGDYEAQRLVASRLAGVAEVASSDRGAIVRLDPVEACAWRTVIINNDNLPVWTDDEIDERRACGPLSPSQQERASLRAAELYAEIAAAFVPPTSNSDRGARSMPLR